MRGKGFFHFTHEMFEGITPACAGKSIIEATSRALNEDHPRMCGEKSSTTKPASSRKGSPPRMRGKAQIRLLSIWQRGITPAYAGKRKTAWKGEGNKRITPACAGKSQIPLTELQHHPGSPPHVRGKAPPTLPALPPPRITPACAGKRLKRSRSTVPPVAIVPLFPSVCNKPVVSDGSPAGRDAPLFLPAENAVPASPAYNLRSL